MITMTQKFWDELEEKIHENIRSNNDEYDCQISGLDFDEAKDYEILYNIWVSGDSYYIENIRFINEDGDVVEYSIESTDIFDEHVLPGEFCKNYRHYYFS